MNTVNKGDIAEHKAIIHFLKTGYTVYKPVSQNSKSDLVIEKDGILKRIQIKSAPLKKDVIHCYCSTSVYDGTNPSKRKLVTYTPKDVDILVYYNDNTDKLYSVAIEQIKDIKQCFFLRVTPTKNNQTEGVWFAKDFELVE